MPVFNRKDKRIAEIKAKAGELIVAIAPEWKQRNMTAAGLELTSKRAQGQTLTADELSTEAAIVALWAQIKAIRDHSDQLEQDVLDGKAVNLETGWPV